MAYALPFVQVAARASVSQIVQRCRSTLNYRHDMFDVKWPARDQFLTLTVFAPINGSLSHSLAQSKSNIGHQFIR